MSDILNELEKMFGKDSQRNIFKNYIEYLRFPFFKNFEKDFKVNFSFPITFLTGCNGSGKSSLLHALYGAPEGKNIADFWYNTKLDPITDLKNNRNCFIYSYITSLSKIQVEVLKTRIHREKKADYWEPSRPVKKYGMEKPPANSNNNETSGEKGERWKLINRNVYYLDFRYTLSAYDKYFYFGSRPHSKTLKYKQDVIRKYAPKLGIAYQDHKPVKSYTRSSNKPIVIQEEILYEISKILGKNYSEAIILEHDLYEKQNKGFAVKYATKNASYSEAFAGSGETAVVKLVYDLFNVEDYSLVLLDEPETSLHPSAQKKLLEFILKQIKNKKLQVVISTHSPDMIENMPPKSIKLLYENPSTQKVTISENIYPENAFLSLGHSIQNKKKLIVEDALAKLLVEKILEKNGDSELFEVQFFPGGESRIKQENMLVYSKSGDKQHFVLFDGDQKRDKLNTDTIPPNERNIEKLKEYVKKIVGEEIKFNTDSGNKSEEQKVELMIKYIDYHNQNVFYLPRNIPEEIIWNEDIFKRADLDAAEKNVIDNETDLKKKFNLFAKYNFGNDKADYQYNAYEYFITRILKQDNNDIKEIERIIAKIKSIPNA